MHKIKAFPKIYSTGKGGLIGTTVQFFQPSPSAFTSVRCLAGEGRSCRRPLWVTSLCMCTVTQATCSQDKKQSLVGSERSPCISAVDCESEEIQVGSGKMLTSAPVGE